MSKRIEYLFDFSCPFAYLGSTEIEALAGRAGASLEWSPFLLGGLLRTIGAEETLAKDAPAKKAHEVLDAERWAEVRGVPLRRPVAHPMRTVRALRTVLSVDEAARPALIHALYRAYWQRGEAVEDDAVLRAALGEAGVTGAAADQALERAGEPAAREELRRRTDGAVARGVFGAPTLFVHRDDGTSKMFWGQDRMEMAEAWLAGRTRRAGPADAPAAAAGDAAAAQAPATGAVIEFWYDFSSPYAYLGATQVEAVAARAGARLEWRPMLLGAIFRAIATPNVPLFSMSQNKRSYMLRDLTDWATWWGVPFRYPKKFPQKTITAARLAMLAGPRTGELSHALFRVMWADDGDLEDEATLTEVLARLGFDAPAMLARTREPEVKQALIDAGELAVARGVFGAPGLVLRQGERTRLFWGQDRLELVERAARGLPPSR
jgi:2-hydroxychromene-2-carboxylate isomerase